MTPSEYGRQLAASAPPLTEGQIEQAARILASVLSEHQNTSARPHIPEPAATVGEPLRRLLPYADAATYLGISRRAMAQLAAEGRVPKVHLGNRVLFDRIDLDTFVDQLKPQR